MNEVFLEIFSWEGSVCGEHLEGTLHYDWDNRIVLYQILDQEEADYLNKKEKSPGMYKVGEKSKRWRSYKKLKAEAIKVYKEKFPDADVLIYGDPVSSAMPQSIIDGPYWYKKEIELLVVEYDKAHARFDKCEIPLKDLDKILGKVVEKFEKLKTTFDELKNQEFDGI